MFSLLVEMINTPLVGQYFPTRPHTNHATQMGRSETLTKQQQIGLVSGCGWESFIWFVSTGCGSYMGFE